MSGRASPYMGTLVSALFAFGAHAVSPLLGLGVRCIVLPWHFARASYSSWSYAGLFPSGLPLCQVVNALSWAFPALLSFMPAPLTLRFSYIARACLISSHARAIFYILHSLIPFLPGEDFPPSVDILHMYPCIEHRYVPLLGISLFSLMTLVSS